MGERRLPAVHRALLVAILAAVGACAQSPASSAEVSGQPAAASTAAHPQTVDDLADPTRTDAGPGFVMLQNVGYRCAYDEARKGPAWVTYTLAGSPSGAGYVREEGFDPDPRTAAHVTTSDYTRSGYDRGHMAPSYAIFAFYGAAAERETYLMSNILPQRHGLNAGPWEKLEALEARSWAPQFGRIRIWCGPEYVGPPYTGEPPTIGHGVAVPLATWKIIVRASSPGHFEALAFLMPQAVGLGDAPEKYLVPVRAIEGGTQLDFLSNLPREEQDAIEQRTAPHGW